MKDYNNKTNEEREILLNSIARVGNLYLKGQSLTEIISLFTEDNESSLTISDKVLTERIETWLRQSESIKEKKDL